MKNLWGIIAAVVTFIFLKVSEEASKELWPVLKESYKHIDWQTVGHTIRTEIAAQKILIDPPAVILALRFVFKGSAYKDFPEKCIDFSVVLSVVSACNHFILIALNLSLGNDTIIHSLVGRKFSMAVDGVIISFMLVRSLIRVRASNRAT